MPSVLFQHLYWCFVELHAMTRATIGRCECADGRKVSSFPVKKQIFRRVTTTEETGLEPTSSPLTNWALCHLSYKTPWCRQRLHTNQSQVSSSPAVPNITIARKVQMLLSFNWSFSPEFKSMFSVTRIQAFFLSSGQIGYRKQINISVWWLMTFDVYVDSFGFLSQFKQSSLFWFRLY